MELCVMVWCTVCWWVVVVCCGHMVAVCYGVLVVVVCGGGVCWLYALWCGGGTWLYW